MGDCWTGRHLVKGDGDKSCSWGLVLGEDEGVSEAGLDVNLCWLTG